MSNRTPDVGFQLAYVRSVAMIADVPDETRLECLRKLDHLEELPHSMKNHIIAGLHEVAEMMACSDSDSDSDSDFATSTEEGSELEDDTDTQTQEDNKSVASQAALDCDDSGAEENHATAEENHAAAEEDPVTAVGIKPEFNSDAEEDEGDKLRIIEPQEPHVSEQQPKKEESDPSESMPSKPPSEMELKLMAVFSKQNICEAFARGECCQLEHPSKVQLDGALKSKGKAGALEKGHSSKVICENHARGQCCTKQHRSRGAILHMLDRVEPSLTEYFSFWPFDDTFDDIDLDAPPRPYVAPYVPYATLAPPSGSFTSVAPPPSPYTSVAPSSGSYTSGPAGSRGLVGADHSKDEPDKDADSGKPLTEEEQEAIHTKKALEKYGICKDYHYGECCGRIHVSPAAARALMPKQQDNFLAQKKKLIEEKNVCWTNVTHHMSVEHGSANVKPPCCPLRHPDPKVMSEEVQKYMDDVSRKQIRAQKWKRKLEVKALRDARTPKHPGLIRASPTHR